jgi:dihydroflavonol-4-reductase
VKALVTGGTGFVGSHVARALVDAGHTVRVLHRASSKLDALAGISFESAIGDILDSFTLEAACRGCDWVFHVAAVADYWRADRARMIEANVEGTRRVLAAARAAGVERVVFTSSASAIGPRADGMPSDETDPFALPPEHFPYAHSKALAEAVADEAVASGQDVVIVNPVIVMGPGDLNLISGTFVLQVHQLSWLVPVTPGGAGFTDVRDVARWHLAAAERGRTGERYILGTANFAYAEWYALIAAVIGVPAPGLPVPAALLPPLAALIDRLRALGIAVPVDGNQVRLGARRIFFNYDKAWRELGEPRIEMRQSIADTFNWYADHGFIRAPAHARRLLNR